MTEKNGEEEKEKDEDKTMGRFKRRGNISRSRLATN